MWIRWIQRRQRSFASSARIGSVPKAAPLVYLDTAGRPRSRTASSRAVAPATSCVSTSSTMAAIFLASSARS